VKTKIPTEVEFLKALLEFGRAIEHAWGGQQQSKHAAKMAWVILGYVNAIYERLAEVEQK
jgi:hypothetical protein